MGFTAFHSAPLRVETRRTLAAQRAVGMTSSAIGSADLLPHPLSRTPDRRPVSPLSRPLMRQWLMTDPETRCSRPEQLPAVHTPLEEPHRQRDIVSPRPLPS